MNMKNACCFTQQKKFFPQRIYLGEISNLGYTVKYFSVKKGSEKTYAMKKKEHLKNLNKKQFIKFQLDVLKSKK